MPELEPIAPAEAKEMFLAQRRDEVAEATLQGYHYRLKPFVQWCGQEDITNLNTLTARALHKYRLWRKEDGDLKPITLKGQLSTLRVFLQFLESIDGVEQGLHDKLLIPSIEDEEAVSNSILDSERAKKIFDYLDKYEYASKRHALITILWHTGCRLGVAHSLDVSDLDAEEQAIAVRHRPDYDTPLTNKQSGERICALSKGACVVLEDFIEVNCDDMLIFKT